MLHRAILGWVLAGAFCASVSCGGDNNSSGPKGFGLACTSDKVCSQYDLFCGGDDTCVQCIDDGDCKSSQTCSGGLCKTPVACEDSRDCSSEQVCNEKSGACVDCLTNRDCKTGELCSNNTCSDRPLCEFTSDCSDGLVCDVDLGVCVTCRNDSDCGYRRVCEASECVSEPMETGGSGGSGGSSAGTGGRTTTGGVGGKPSGGGGAGGTTGGKGGTGGTVAGGGGGNVDCDCLNGQVCAPDLRCVDPTLIDDLVDCDDQIIAIEGRSGSWAADADIGIAFDYDFTDPGALYQDRTCAAWMRGSELTLNDPDATFAFIGFMLNGGLAYDLSDYTGLQIRLESDSTVQVVLKTTGNGYFYVKLDPLPGSSNQRAAPFELLLKMDNSDVAVFDPSTVTEVQFSVEDRTSFELAVHRVELY